MPNAHDRVPNSVLGRYYVDTSCIDCDQCRTSAPQFFTRNNELGLSYVYRQPRTPEELEVAEDALSSCPSESIGNDGADADVTTPPSASAA